MSSSVSHMVVEQMVFKIGDKKKTCTGLENARVEKGMRHVNATCLSTLQLLPTVYIISVCIHLPPKPNPLFEEGATV